MIKIFNVFLETSDVFLLGLDRFFYELDTFNGFLEAFKIVDLALYPLNDLIVRIAKLLRQPVHHLLILMVRMRNYALFLVRICVEIDARMLIFVQFVEQVL